MKNFTIVFALMQFISFALHAQTRYGTSSGTQGGSYSYFGYYAGNAATSSSNYNAYFGAYVGRNTTTGDGNTAMGYNALYANTTGYSNTAAGALALTSNVSGAYNVAIGNYALHFNTANGNTANGYSALYANTNGYENTAMGYLSLTGNTTGDRNVAIGNFALNESTTASNNTATGSSALEPNITGGNNSAYGYETLTTVAGVYNSVFGSQAFYAPYPLECTNSYNSGLGSFTGTGTAGCFNYNNSTALGYHTLITASNQVRVGNSDVVSIGGQVGWSTLSDGRFKRDIRKDVAGLDFINQLNPVSYILDKDAFDKFLGIPDSMRLKRAGLRKMPQRQVGFVAQEVEAILKKSGYVFSGIVTPKNESDPYAIRYSEFVVPLVKAAQELSATISKQQQEIGRLKEALTKYLEETRAREGRSAGLRLFQNHPNPFSTVTEIQMDVPEITRHARLVIYNPEGKELKSIEVNERGATKVKISGGEFNPGMYLYTLIADGNVVDTKRLILTK